LSTLAPNRFRPGLLALAIVIGCSPFAVAGSPADTVIVNAHVYTVNSRQPWAEAVAITGGHVVAVGSAKQVGAYLGSSTKVIDAGGRLVLPGFTDSHIHFLDGSISLQQLQLDDVPTLAEVQQRIKAYATAHPELPWILGRGWSYPIFGPAAIPHKKFLDEIVPDRPVYLTAFDGHTWWANSKALELAGVTAKTPDPPNGWFVRDSRTGEPTGAIKEDAADAIVEAAIPSLSRQQKLQALRAGLREANRAGLVRVHCLGELRPTPVSDFDNLDLYDELRSAGDLTIRLYVASAIDPPALDANELRQIEAARRHYHDDWISAGAAKFFLDGVIETHTAAMLAPYSDDSSQSGTLLWDPAKFRQAVAELDRRGIQIFTHAIGDRAIRLALDAYENTRQINHTEDARNRVEHIEDASADDIPRFGKLGVIASFQPLHAYPEADTLNVWVRNVGPERAQRAWAWHSIQNAGGHLTFGSDWPIVTLSPWPGLQTAVTRQTAEGNPPGGLVPSERISLEDAIHGYTLGAAFAGHREMTEGSIEPGKLADLIVVSQDLFRIEPSQISRTEVLLTIVGGKVVYQSASWVDSMQPIHGKEKP
jgi:predicted amidohydrolase YtcJ